MSYRDLLQPEVLVFLVGGTIAVIAIVGGCIARVLVHREEARLKARMVERGFSAEEIERVVHASPSHAINKQAREAATHART